MHLRICFLMGTLLLATLAGCGGPDYQPPDVKTNPDPKQRYTITVTLVDPPPGIKNITGMTHFVPGTPCRPLVNSIAGVPVGASYEKAFSLTKVADNTYRGHIYLDWPVDEDYYGLGVCEWKLRVATALIKYSGHIHDIDLRGDTDFPTGSRKWLCSRVEDSEIHTRGCVSPLNKEIEEKFGPDSYTAFISTTKE